MIYADCRYELASAWPSRALSHVDIRLSAAAFRPGRHSWRSRHRDPAPVGVSYTVPVESSLLHCIRIDELPKEGAFRFRPALVNSGGSIIMFRFFRACVNFFRFILRPRCRPGASVAPTEPGGIPRGGNARSISGRPLVSTQRRYRDSGGATDQRTQLSTARWPCAPNSRWQLSLMRSMG